MVSFEFLNILWIGWIVFILYQIGLKIDQFIILLINDHPNLKNKKKNILLFGKLTYSFLVLFTVSLIIGDIFYDLSSVILATSITASKSNKIIIIVKCFLVFILKSLLIFIDYKLSGLKSRRFIFTLISLIIFITFTFLIYSDCLSLSETYKVCTIITSAFILDWLGIPNLMNPAICNVIPEISKRDIPSNYHNKPQESLPSRYDGWELQKGKRPIRSMNDWLEARNGKSKYSSQRYMDHHKDFIDDPVDEYDPWSAEALAENRWILRQTPTQEECVKKMVTIDKSLSDINDIERGKVGTQKHYKLEDHPGVSTTHAREVFLEDKRVLEDRWKILDLESEGKKEVKTSEAPAPGFIQKRLRIWHYGNCKGKDKPRGGVRRSRFKFHKEEFKLRGKSPLKDEVK
jgi:hypothetical protein